MAGDPLAVGELAEALERLQRHLPDPLGDAATVGAYAAKLRERAWLGTLRAVERVTGLLAMYANDRQTLRAFVSILVIEPDHARRGWGRRLLHGALDEARRCGMRRVALKVRPDNLPARRLYERTGFHRVGSLDGKDLMEVAL